MKILNPELLESFRTPGRCEICDARCSLRCAHHIFPKGSGGARRKDVPINLIHVAMPFGGCSCHQAEHNDGSAKSREKLVKITALREGLDWAKCYELLLRMHYKLTDWLCACPRELQVQVGRHAWCCLGCGKAVGTLPVVADPPQWISF